MRSIRPGVIVSVGPVGLAFGRSVSRRLAEERVFGEFISHVEITFLPGQNGVVCDRDNRPSHIVFPVLDPAGFNKVFDDHKEQILAVFTRHYEAVFGDFDPAALNLAGRGINVLPLLDFVILSATHEPLAAVTSLRIANLLAERLGMAGADSFRITGFHFLPSATASPAEQANAYAFLSLLDRALDTHRTSRPPFDDVHLVDLAGKLAEAVQQAVSAENPSPLPENPVTEPMAQTFLDPEMFSTCQEFAGHFHGLREHGKAVPYRSLGAHVLEYNGPQLVQALSRQLGESLIKQVLLAVLPADDHVRATFESWRNTLVSELADLACTAQAEAIGLPPDQARSLAGQLSLSRLEPGASGPWEHVAQVVYFDRSISDPQTNRALAAFTERLTDEIYRLIDYPPLSYAWARMMCDYFCAAPNEYFAKAGSDPVAEVAQPVLHILAERLLTDMGQCIEQTANLKRPSDLTDSLQEGPWRDPRTAETFLASFKPQAGSVSEVAARCLPHTVDLVRSAVALLATWPIAGPAPLDDAVVKFARALEQISDQLIAERKQMQQEIQRLHQEEAAFRRRYGLFKRLWRRREFSDGLRALMQRRLQCEMRQREIDAKHEELHTGFFIPTLDRAFRWRFLIHAFARAAQAILAVREDLAKALKILSEAAKAHRSQFDGLSYTRTLLRTSIINKEIAEEIYEEHHVDVPSLAIDWVQFPGDLEPYKRKRYADIKRPSGFLDAKMQLAVEKLADFAEHYFQHFAEKTIADMLLRKGKDAAKGDLRNLMGSASPLLRTDGNIVLNNPPARRLFAMFNDPEHCELTRLLAEIDPEVQMSDNADPQHFEMYSYLFGVPAFLIAAIRSYHTHYKAGDAMLQAPAEPDLLPDFLHEAEPGGCGNVGQELQP